MALPSASSLIVEPIGLDANTIARPLDLPAIFGNDHPVELEIGMGKGTFLVDQSRRHPEVNFIGVEYANWYWRYASDRLRRNNCLNVRTFRTEAGHFVKQLLPAGSLSAIHIYFPDPWPKKRHHKRRLITPPFLLEVHRVLRPAGQLRIVTDFAGYFEQIDPVVRSSPLSVIPFEPEKSKETPESPEPAELTGTNFERKYRREGRPFFAIAAIKP